MKDYSKGIPGYDRWKTQTPEEYYGISGDDDDDGDAAYDAWRDEALEREEEE